MPSLSGLHLNQKTAEIRFLCGFFMAMGNYDFSGVSCVSAEPFLSVTLGATG